MYGMLDNNFIRIRILAMEKLKELFNFIKNNLNGETTKKTLLVILIIIMYKILGILGLALSLLAAIGVDIYGTANLKDVYTFFKTKFFPIMVIGLILVGCAASKSINNSAYSISRMTIVSKDTISSKVYRVMVSKNEIPSLDKFAKTHLRNIEENKVNAYYVYYDSISSKLFNVKEIICHKDTTYILEKKLFRK